MKFGVRQICNVVFRANEKKKIGNREYQKGEPVFYIDTAKASSIEGNATTVYAQGGRGNTRLVTWEGEKTLTFSVEDALLSPISFSALSGAGVVKGDSSEKVHVHQTTKAMLKYDTSSTKFIIDLADIIDEKKIAYADDTSSFDATAPIYVMGLTADGDLDGNIYGGFTVATLSTAIGDTAVAGSFVGLSVAKTGLKINNADSTNAQQTALSNTSTPVLVDYYVKKTSSNVTELQIDAQNFGGSFYVEADTLFRRKGDNVDLPANITLPNVKIQSNFTFSMSASGDPSTFNFTMDAMPGYTYFNKTREVLCAIQIIDDPTTKQQDIESVFKHSTDPAETDNSVDSYPG